MRKVFAVAALSLFLAVGVSAAPVRDVPRDEPPLVKFIRMVKKAIRTLGDAPVSPRP